MSFVWWHTEFTSTCFIIVTIVEIHRLIIDSYVTKQLLAISVMLQNSVFSPLREQVNLLFFVVFVLYLILYSS